MFWENKKVLITGHTGFKGAWLALMLKNLGANIYGVCRPQHDHAQFYQLISASDLFSRTEYADIQDYARISALIQEIVPDVIFHLAAQPLVKSGYQDPLDTFKTNMLGSLNVLEIVRRASIPCSIVNVTTDKVYQNRRLADYAYQESDALGGADPYSASKAAVELVSQCYTESFFKGTTTRLATARAGNVIGGGDFANHRLIPDIIQSLADKKPIQIRHPNFIRPWQYVLDALYGYIILAEKLQTAEEYRGAYNFGPDHTASCSVKALVEKAIQLWGSGSWIEVLDKTPEEAYLMLNSQKAISQLGWMPKYNIDSAIAKTINWYKAWFEGQDMKIYSEKEIIDFLEH